MGNGLNNDGSQPELPAFGTSGTLLGPVILPTTEAYTIDVTPLGVGSLSGSITLTLYNLGADVSSSIVIGGPSVNVTITQPGQGAEVTFSGTAGKTIVLQAGAGMPTTNCDGYYGPGGTFVTIYSASLMDHLYNRSVPSTGATFPSLTLPGTATYTIHLVPCEDNTGTVSLTLTDLPRPTTTAASSWTASQPGSRFCWWTAAVRRRLARPMASSRSASMSPSTAPRPSPTPSICLLWTRSTK